MTYKDWRPEKLDVESIATDAQLTRIEAKLDKLLAMGDADRHICSPSPWRPDVPVCCVCGKTLNRNG